LIPLEQQSRGDKPLPVEIFTAVRLARRVIALSIWNYSRPSLICRWKTSPGAFASTKNGASRTGPVPCNCSRWRSFLLPRPWTRRAICRMRPTCTAKNPRSRGNARHGQLAPAKRRPATGPPRLPGRLRPQPGRRRVQRGRPRPTQQSQAPAGARRLERAPGRHGGRIGRRRRARR